MEVAATSAGVSQDDYKKFIAYSAGFYGNLSNYHNFGAKKFIPDLTPELFKKILTSNPLYSNENAFYKQVVDELLPQIETEIFNIEAPYTCLGIPHEGGVTAYFSRSMTKEDLALIKEFLIDQKIDILTTRAFKEEGKIIITVGSISNNGSKSDVEFKGQKFDI